jgi:hypothetical protein
MKSLKRATCFLSFREPMERSLLLTLLLCSCSVHAQAQNIEGQVVASQYGEWKVPSIGIGFSFDPASCQLSAGGKNFAAFTNGTPIKVVDENPNLTEVSNATVYAHVDSGSCSVSLGGLAYGHTSFYLTSGTGGLQEALSSGIQATGGPNTVILNAEWYALVAPSNPATVIASVQGSATLGLVDVTTTPYSTYSWNGTQFILNTSNSATIPATGLVLKGGGTPGLSTPATPGTDYVIPSGSITGTAANLSGTPTLPNGTAAATQPTSDNTTRIATDAFVKTAVSGNSSYSAGTGGVAANTVVMGDGTGNVIPFVNSTHTTVNYGLYVGIATAAASIGNPVPVANSSGELAACQFDGTPVVGDTVIGSTTTPGDCHDAGTTGSYVTPYMPIVGWIQSVSGTLGTVRMAGLGVWGSANLVVDNTLSTQSFYGALTTPTVSSAQVNTVYDVDGFSAASSYYYSGIGVAQTVWSSSVNYPQCSAVSYGGNNYLSVVYLTTATPGFASAVWYPVPNSNTPTALDCAFYTAAASIITGTGTITGNSQGSQIQLGIGTYNTCIGLKEPTVTTPGWWTVSIKGSAIGPSKILQNCAISNPALEQPPSTANYALARFLWENFTVDAHENAPAVVGLYGSQQSVVKNLDLYNAALGNDHYMEIGAAGNTGWVYELDMENVQLGATYGGCNGATFSTTVTGGVPAITVTNGGTGCNVNWPPTPVLIQPGGAFCNGTNTLTFSSGAITGFTTTATGCNSATTAAVFSGPNVSYGFKFTNMSDSHFIHSLICSGIGSVDCIYISNVTSFNTFYKMHPIASMDGIQNNGRNDFFSTQMDTVYRRGFDFESGYGTVNVYGSMFEWAGQQNGAGDYFFGATSNPPVNAPYSINIYGDMCGSSPTFLNYYHFGETNGIIDSGSLGLPSTVHVHETNYCNQTGNSPANAPDYVGLQYNWSPGAWGNVFQFNMNPTAGGTPTMTLTNPLSVSGSNIGVYDWDWGTAAAATSSFNAKSPTMGWCSPYWNGTATTPLCVNSQLSYASGSNPLATLAFTYSGTLPTAGARYTFDNPVIVPAGSTAVTQAAGDNSTKIATDAFVLANASGGLVSSVFGRTGAVAATSGDYSVSQVTGAAPLASPALTGTPTAPTQTTGDNTTKVATDAFVQSAIANCTASAHGVINGVSYTNCYSGSTFDARVNAAMSDAENLANGNTTGHVASEYEPQAVTQTGQITVGDGAHLVYWTLGAGMYDSVTLTSGSAYAVLQNPKSSITCLGSVPSNDCVFVNFSAANNIDALYSTNGAGYYALRGVSFTNHGSTMASGHNFIVNGGYDSSIWDGITIYDSPSSNPSDGSVATFTNFCCHANVTNFIADSEWGATAIELDGSSGSSFGAVNFHNITANSHGPTATGNPNILCHDTGPGLYSKASFTGSLYMEGQSAASQTAAWIQSNGCQAMNFSGASVEAHSESTSTTSQIIDVSSAFETTISIGTVATSGGGWGLPATIIRQHNTTSDCGAPPCNVAVTDSAGNSPIVSTRTAQFDNLAFGGAVISTNTVDNAAITFATGSGGDSTCPTPASGSSYLCTKASGIAASINGGGYAAIAGTKVYTVSTLPAASSLPAGTQLTVSDANSFTPGTCTGSGSDYMIAITNGSSWSCH